MNAPDLYHEVWTNDAYRLYAPGAQCVGDFLDMSRPDGEVIDFGTGTGRGAWLIHTVGRVPVRMIDFADNCLDRAVRESIGEGLKFEIHDLREWHEPLAAQWGYCTDVMEHMAPEDVDKVLWNIVRTARHVFFSISTTPDDYGNLMVGEPLHLTVQPHEWWRAKFEAMHCKVIWERDNVEEKLSQWYVTAYVRGSDLGEFSSHNTTADIVKANVKANLALGLPEIRPYEEQDTHVCLLAGGPSLSEGEHEIIDLARSGAKIVTVNATYKWALDRGMTPGAQIIVDAREFNSRFCHPINDKTRYLICSQCSPTFVGELPPAQTVLWHAGGSDLFEQALNEYDQEHDSKAEHWLVPGGTTVMMRAIPLLLILGFRKISVFGWDSCIMDGKHHAYAQPENDVDCVRTMDMTIGGRTWQCAGWQAIQAHEFIQMVKFFPDELQLEVKGDGLLAGILKYAAEMATKGAQ